MRCFVAALTMLSFGNSVFADECQKLCSPDWWLKATSAEVQSQLQLEDVNSHDKNGLPPLTIMASIGDIDAVVSLIKAGAKVNFGILDGSTALYWAARYEDNAEVIRALIAAGGSPVSFTFQKETPLSKAAVHGDYATIAAIIAKSAHVTAYLDYMPDSGGNALMRAARYQPPEVIELLLEAGADPSVKDQRGKKAADYAKSNRRLVGTTVLQRLSE